MRHADDHARHAAILGIAVGYGPASLVTGLPGDVFEERRFNPRLWADEHRGGEYVAEELHEQRAVQRVREGLKKTLGREVRGVGAEAVAAVAVAVPTRSWVANTSLGKRLVPRAARRGGTRYGGSARVVTLPHPVAVALGYCAVAGDEGVEPGEYLVVHADYADAYAAVVSVKSSAPRDDERLFIHVLAEKHCDPSSYSVPTEDVLDGLLQKDFRIPADNVAQAKQLLFEGESAAWLSRVDDTFDFDDVLDRLLGIGVLDNLENMIAGACRAAGIPVEAVKDVWPDSPSGFLVALLEDVVAQRPGSRAKRYFFVDREEFARPAAEGAWLYAHWMHTGTAKPLVPQHPDYGIVVDGEGGEELVPLIPAEVPLPAQGTVVCEVQAEEADGFNGEVEVVVWTGLGRCSDVAWRGGPQFLRGVRVGDNARQVHVTLEVDQGEATIRCTVHGQDGTADGIEIPRTDLVGGS